MDGARFDAWTRRAFGLAAGGALAALFGRGGLMDVAVGKKRKNKNKMKKKKTSRRTCKPLRFSCQPGDNTKQRCCPGLACDAVEGLSGPRCCQGYQTTCGDDSECCGSADCGLVDGLDGDRCCGVFGARCDVDEDCCDDVNCIENQCGVT
jgi:hypothetical protein